MKVAARYAHAHRHDGPNRKTRADAPSEVQQRGPWWATRTTLEGGPNYGDPNQNTATRRAANLRGPHLALACKEVFVRIRLRIEGVSDSQKP